MKQTPQVLIREYFKINHMNRDAQKLNQQGWLIADTQVVSLGSDNAGCGCLFGLFGSMRSKQRTKYIVRYEKRAAA